LKNARFKPRYSTGLLNSYPGDGLLPALIISALALLFILWLLGEPYLSGRKRQRIRAQPFPAAWREILKRRVHCVRAH